MAEHLRSIGETVSLLRNEFPGVSVSKIRFLEAEGLVVPLRTPSGYRKYTPQHVERIRYILAAQRDHYLPLKVIAEHLDAMDRGLRPPDVADATPRAPQPQPAPAEPVLDLDTGVRLTDAEIRRESGLSDQDFHDAVDVGLLPGAGPYDLNDAECARALAALAGIGLPPRNLRPVWLAVRRETDLHATAVGPRRPHETDEEFEQRRSELAHRLLDLHVALTRRALL